MELIRDIFVAITQKWFKKKKKSLPLCNGVFARACFKVVSDHYVYHKSQPDCFLHWFRHEEFQCSPGPGQQLKKSGFCLSINSAVSQQQGMWPTASYFYYFFKTTFLQSKKYVQQWAVTQDGTPTIYPILVPPTPDFLFAFLRLFLFLQHNQTPRTMNE